MSQLSLVSGRTISKISKILVLSLLASLLTVAFGAIQVAAPLPAQAAVTNGSIAFDGSTVVSYSASSIGTNGTSNATIEFWIKPQASQGTGCCNRILSQTFGFGDASNPIILRYGGGGYFFLTVANKSVTTYTVPTPGAWSHIAIVDKLGTWQLFINGVSIETIAAATIGTSTNLSNSNFTLGGDVSGEKFNGSISNFRYVNGSALYWTNNFTPPTAPLTSISGTQLLLNTNYDGTQATALADSSGNNATPTMSGGTGITASNSWPTTPQNISFSQTAYSLAYGSTQQLTLNGVLSTGAKSYSAGSSTACTVSATGLVTVTSGSGTCSISGSVAADSTYSLATTGTPVTVTVSPAAQATLTASASITSSSWSGSAYTAVPSFSTSGGSGTGAVTYTVASGTATGCSLNSNAANATLTASSPGTCTVTATKAATTLYTSTTATLTFTFSKSASTIGLTLAQSSIAYGTQNTLTATVYASSATGSVSFQSNGIPISACSSVAISSGQALCSTWVPNAGTYSYLTAVYSGDSNNVTSTSSSTSLTVSKATLTVAPDAKSVSFGSAAPAYTFTYQGFVNGESAGSTSFTTGLTPPTCTSSNPVYSTTTSVSISPTISCSGGTSTNYSFITTATSALTVTQAASTVSLTPSTNSPVYGSSFTLTATSSTPANVVFNAGGSPISGCASVATTTVSPYTATCTWVMTSLATTQYTAVSTPTNTNFASQASNTIGITAGKAAITITPTSNQSKTYGTADPALTYAITSGALIGADTLSGSLTYTSAGLNTAVGSYAILIGTLANSNYTITLASVNFTITGASQGAISLSTTSATWSATQKTIALSGTGGSGTGAYTYALDAPNSAAGCSVASSTLTYTTAGTCSVSVTRAASGNYAAVTSPVSVAISKASQTITFTQIASQVFSVSTLTASATASSSLTPVAFTSTTTSVCTVSGSTITMVSAGTCTLSADQSGNTNYLAATTASMSFTITAGSQGGFTLSQQASSANSLSATPNLSTSGGSGTGAVTYSTSNGTATGCQLSSTTSASATLSASTPGTCLITATKAADSAYSSATSTALTFTFNGNPANAPINLSATPSSGSAALTWTHVDTTGASAISTFSVQYAANAGAWQTFTHTASTLDSITVTGLTNGTTYSFRVAAVTNAGAGTYSSTVTAKPLGLAFTPVFGTPTSTADGFTVNITNWNPAFVWGNAQVTSGSGTVTVGTGANSILPMTVTGMTPGSLATISITASQTSYSDGTAYASGSALKAALIPVTTGLVTNTSGLTATISNFDSLFTWSASATSGAAAVSASGAVAVTGVNPLTTLTLTITSTRSGYASGVETRTATTLQLLRIFYDGNGNTGGSAPTDATTYQSGATGTVLGNTGSLTKSGYTFIGWTLNSANTGQVYSAGNIYSLGLVGITLYAKWTAIPYTVTYQSTDATSGVAPLDQNAQGIQNIYNIGQNAPILANSSLVRTGYSFGGWADNYPRTGTIYQSGGIYPITTNNVALYPIWTPNTYTVTYNVNSAVGSPSNSSDSYTTASTAITLPTVGTMAKTGYAFTGWGRTAVSTPITGTLTVTTDTTLYAQWTLQSYAVTYLPGTFGTGTVPTQASVAYGSSFTLASPTGLTGTDGTNSYAFVAWSDGSGTTFAPGKTLLMGAAPLTLTGLWTRIYNVTYSFNGGSVSTPIADQQKISGETITVTSEIPTRTGYTFTNWLDQSSLSAVAGDSYTVSDTHYLIYAQWSAISYSVRYDTSGGSTVPAEPSHTIGEIFTTATLPTKNGYDFAGWSDGVTTYAAGSPYQVGAANVSLIALWTPQVYDVSYDFNGGFGSAISPTHYTFATPAITLPTSGPTRPDFTFSGWSTSTTGAGVGATFTPSSSITLHAVWVSSVYRLIFDAGSGFTDTSTAKVTIGQSLTLPTGTRTNYNLAGWSTQQSGGTLVSGTYTPTADATMYAQWTLKVYVVTFNGNGGTASTGSASMTAGTTSPVTLTTAARSNYVFNGWYSDPQSGYLLGDAGSSYLPTNSITAYAHWIQASLAGMGAATQIAQVTVHAGYENSFTAGSNGSTVALYYPADSLPDGSIITAYLENSTTRASTLITTPSNLILSLIVAWVAPDGTVPTTATGKPITLTISNPNITAGSKVYGYLSGVMTYLGMAAVDGSAVITISQDPVLVVAITTPDAPTGVTTVLNGSTGATISWSAPAASGGSAITSYVVTSSSGQSCTTTTTSCSITGLTAGSNYTFTVVATNSLGTSSVSTASSSLTITPPVVVVDNSAAIAAAAAQAAADAAAQAAAVKAAQEAAAKALADKQAADAAAKLLAEKAEKEAIATAKALADKQAAEAAAKILADQEAAALKAAQEKMAADAKALAEAKAAADAAAVKAAQDAADASAKAAAELQAAKDAAAAQAAAAALIKPAVTLYSVTPKLTLSAYGTAYLQKYVRSLKNGATVTCVGYIYKKGTTLAKATALAKSQATAVCALIKKSNKTLKTTISLLDSSKAPKAAVGSKWVAVSYRIDSFKARG